MKTTADPIHCPFCGEIPGVGPWHGGGPRKRMVSCGSLTCPVNPFVTGSTRKRAVALWNMRSDGKAHDEIAGKAGTRGE